MLIINEKAKIGDIVKSSNSSNLGIYCEDKFHAENKGLIKWNKHNLYVLSDDEIKEGDIILTKDYGIWEYRKAPCPLPYWGNTDGCKKIIASTDKIIVGWDYRNDIPNGNDYNKFIHSIPEEFIKLYIKKYNSGNPIEEVEVEYEPIGNWRHAQFVHTRDIPIIDSNNCISIQSTKDNYTKKEVIQLLKKYDREFVTTKKLSSLCFDKWIEENF